jgi:hypothetical protein
MFKKKNNQDFFYSFFIKDRPDKENLNCNIYYPELDMYMDAIKKAGGQELVKNVDYEFKVVNKELKFYVFGELIESYFQLYHKIRFPNLDYSFIKSAYENNTQQDIGLESLKKLSLDLNNKVFDSDSGSYKEVIKKALRTELSKRTFFSINNSITDFYSVLKLKYLKIDDKISIVKINNTIVYDSKSLQEALNSISIDCIMRQNNIILWKKWLHTLHKNFETSEMEELIKNKLNKDGKDITDSELTSTIEYFYKKQLHPFVEPNDLDKVKIIIYKTKNEYSSKLFIKDLAVNNLRELCDVLSHLKSQKDLLKDRLGYFKFGSWLEYSIMNIPIEVVTN